MRPIRGIREYGTFGIEHVMIREHISAGLTQAQAKGRIGGRRRKLYVKKRREIAESTRRHAGWWKGSRQAITNALPSQLDRRSAAANICWNLHM